VRSCKLTVEPVGETPDHHQTSHRPQQQQLPVQKKSTYVMENLKITKCVFSSGETHGGPVLGSLTHSQGRHFGLTRKYVHVVLKVCGSRDETIQELNSSSNLRRPPIQQEELQGS
jgi:hypothetical protein